MSEKCFYCDAPGTKLCDFVLGWTIGGYVRTGKVADNQFYATCCIDGPMFTCDMSMCDEHSSYQGMFHASGKAGFSESIDYCPEHIGHKDHKAPPMLEDEAATLRRAVRAAAYRRMMIEKATA